MENNPEFQFDRYFNRYFDYLTNRGGENNRFQYIQKSELAQTNIENLSIENVIAKAINKFEVEELLEKGIVRSDAKTFLMINYRTMVYYPLKDSRKYSEIKLKTRIFFEIQQILREAYRHSSEITAHKVLQAGNEIWDSLGTLNGDSW